MDVKTKIKTEIKVTIEMDQNEARKLKRLLNRLDGRSHIGRSEMSLSEKAVLAELIQRLTNHDIN